MLDREKVISDFQDAIKTTSWDLSHWTFVRTDIVKDAIALLQEQDAIKCKNCEYSANNIQFPLICEGFYCVKHDERHDEDWFCADWERKVKYDD